MRAILKNMKDQILTNDHKVLHCPCCGQDSSGNLGDYWYLPDDHVFTCGDCNEELELVNRLVTVEYK